MRLNRSNSLALCLLAGLVSGGTAFAQAGPGCTLQKQVYTCDRAMFHKAMAEAKTAQVDPLAAAKDRMVAAKLRDLVGTLGKGVPVPDQPADLIFSLVPVETAGVMVGPSGVELAVLRVYGPPARTGPDTGGATPGAATGPLLWAETFSGQPDMSWPATVQATINQFRSGMKR